MDIIEKFRPFRTGDVVLSAGQGLGDLMIFLGRHSTIQHSALLVWLDKSEAEKGVVKVVPRFIDDEATVLGFLGLAEGRKMDIVKQEKVKGMILYEPSELFKNAPIIYVRAIEQSYISDAYVTEVMQSYIEKHHLKTQYAYGKLYIVTTGLGMDILGKHKSGILCSENILYFLKDLCDYPNFRLHVENKEYLQKEGVAVKSLDFGEVEDGKYIPNHPEYKVPDAKDYMHLPDYYASENNTHPVFEEQEFRVLSKKSEVEVTVHHPYFLTFVILVILIVFVFFVISHYCETCQRTGICMIRR